MRARKCGLTLILATLPAWGQSDVRRYQDSNAIFSLPLPAAWTVRPVENDAEFAALTYEAHVLSGQPALEITVWKLPGAARSPRGQAYFESRVLSGRLKPERAFVETDSIARLTLLRGAPDGGRRFYLCGYKIVRRNMLAVSFAGPEELLAPARPHLIRAVQGLETKLPESPAYPADYEKAEQDGLEYRIHDGFPRGDLEPIQEFLGAVRRSYEQRVGSIPEIPGNPLQIVLHAKGHESAPKECRVDARSGRLFATPLPRGDVRARARLARAFADLLHYQRFGGAEIDWVRVGEANLQWLMTLTGEDLPAVTPGFRDQLPAVPVSLAELAARPVAERSAHADAYALFFHCGPVRFRQAFREFLAAGDSDGDWLSAHEKHLESLNPQLVTGALDDFRANDLRIVRPR